MNASESYSDPNFEHDTVRLKDIFYKLFTYRKEKFDADWLNKKIPSQLKNQYCVHQDYKNVYLYNKNLYFIKIQVFIATIILALGAPPALAEPDFSAPSQNISPEVCQNASTRHYMIECLYKEAKESDRRLNEAYRQVSSSLNAKEREELIKTQLTWIKYRDQACDPLLDHVKYGRESAIQYWDCINRLTKQRTVELEND